MGRAPAKRRGGTAWIEGLALCATLLAIATIALPRWGAPAEETPELRCDRELAELERALRDALETTRGRIHAESLPRTFLGPGEAPAFEPPELGPRAALAAFLPLVRETVRDASSVPVGADPWGRAYVLRLHRQDLRVRDAWLLSAGPDGRIETEPFDVRPRGDDRGFAVFAGSR